MTSAPLVVLEILSASVWVGSLVCLAVVSQAARKVLEGPAQVAFFRAVGRRYAVVGTGSLLVAIGVGLTMAWPPSGWSQTEDAAVALAGVLLGATAAGMAQARAMGGLRRRSMAAPQDAGFAHAVYRARRVATALRALMAATTLAIVVLAGLTISR
ncbi:MAG: hypothetical protein ACRDXC_00815 [Acidimicrobiales bacterium]